MQSIASRWRVHAWVPGNPGGAATSQHRRDRPAVRPVHSTWHSGPRPIWQRPTSGTLASWRATDLHSL